LVPWLCDTERVTDTRQPEPRPGAGRVALSCAEIAQATGGRLVRPSSRPIRGAAVDSRKLERDNMFVALPGEHTDGHRFLGAAVESGAACLLVRDGVDIGSIGAPDRGADFGIVAVPDTMLGLQAVAAAWRLRFSPLVVGVTGSIAKTSTKEAIAAVLSTRYATLKSEGNANNEIGLPLTVLQMGPQHEAAVLEMGMYVGGEISTLAAIARPRIGVVTAVLGVHLARIGSIEAVERAKGELVAALPADGVAVLNADDERVLRMSTRTAARALTYGFSPAADVSARSVVSAGLDGMRFTLVTGGGSVEVATPALGRHGVHNGLAAAAVGLAAGLDLDEVAAGLGQGWRAEHRDRLTRTASLTILDDTYNASPASMLAALDLLASLPGRHVAVLGEMRELGDAHEQGHLAVGEAAGGVVDRLVVIGREASPIAVGAAQMGDRVTLVPDRESALAVLREQLRPGDVVLVKASRGVALEWIVERIERMDVSRPGLAGDSDRAAAPGTAAPARSREELP
jgi:UDP-N-acetylmuramoyl-tripeptide--D-alanyl-D-alanine ligase